MMNVIVAASVGGLAVFHAQAQSTSDLWDISQGTVVVNRSGGHWLAEGGGMDPRNMFGGQYGSYVEGVFGNWVFADGMSPGFLHFVEWRTATPVTLNFFNLYAAGDGEPNPIGKREFASFTLKAKSEGSSTYDLTLFSFTPTHWYTFVNSADYLLVSAEIAPITAQDFRAEFENLAGVLEAGPRVMELDAFLIPEPSASGLIAVGLFAWAVRHGFFVRRSFVG
ncbi:MAG TPA: hypothetical protein VI136_24505 [Verrucomicrobiae bacterium]